MRNRVNGNGKYPRRSPSHGGFSCGSMRLNGNCRWLLGITEIETLCSLYREEKRVRRQNVLITCSSVECLTAFRLADHPFSSLGTLVKKLDLVTLDSGFLRINGIDGYVDSCIDRCWTGWHYAGIKS